MNNNQSENKEPDFFTPNAPIHHNWIYWLHLGDV